MSENLSGIWLGSEPWIATSSIYFWEANSKTYYNDHYSDYYPFIGNTCLIAKYLLHMKAILMVETVDTLFLKKPLSSCFATHLGRRTPKIRWDLSLHIKISGYFGKVSRLFQSGLALEFFREACFAYWLKRKHRACLRVNRWVSQDRQTKVSLHLRLSHMHWESTSSSDWVLQIFSWATWSPCLALIKGQLFTYSGT